ncbi:hypothetical protein Tcan_04446 [Toxocara canis]|uniref:TTI1 N-terminal TPR domain-containing protein n=1 Tax=Toxocara canis TaxID=6265 RepID=A0A0B2VEB6_TOXCA|nr:hypothetical protein Tcan_04446 [Toxocara canis]
MNADVVVPQELSTFHTICAITAIEANSSQPNNELITKLNISAKNAMLLEGLPSKNRQMIMQMSLFIVRKSIEAIVKYGLTQPIDSLREFLENICAFYRSHDAIGGINEEVSSAILRIISNVCMLLEKPMGIPTLDSLFRVLNKLVSTVVEVDVLRKELSSSKRMPLAAAIVHICLELFQATNRDVRIRLSAARVLRRFIVGAKRSDNVYQVAFVLPGILSRTHKVATTDQNSFILLEALLIAANAIEATMNNKVFDRERAHKSDEATAECGNGNGLLKGQIITIAAKPSQGVGEAGDDGECGGIPPTDIFTDDNRNIIGNTMKQIAARLCGNVDFRVRMCVIDCIKFVYVRCVRALGKAIEKTVEDVGTLLLEDKYKCIREKSIALLRLTRNKALKEESLKRKLLGLCRAIKIQIWQNGDIQMPFQQMCGMLLHAKVTDLSEILKSDGKAFEELIECFASCAVVNRSAMELVVEVDENFKKLDFCSRIRLRSGIGISDLKKLCYKLIKCDAAGSAMLYCESKMAFTSSVEQRLAFEIISLLIMCEFYTELRKGGRRMLHDFNVESVCKSIIDRFSVELDGADFIETAVIGDYDTTVVRRAVGICIMGAAFRCIGSKERRYRLLSRCMLHVLEWRTSAVRLISIAAEEAACDLAKGMEEPSVSMLCFKYANTLLSHICVSGEAWQLVRSARLVTSLLDLCNEKAFFETACLLNGQMISLLDRSDAVSLLRDNR